jgi:hypothetical protein
VISGSGSGKYYAGVTVMITANPAAPGKAFDRWTSDYGVTFANANSQSTTFTMLAEFVMVTATYIDLESDVYAISVQNDGNGTAYANVNSATAGAEIRLTAVGNQGYRLKEWEVIRGNVTIVNNRFIMPPSNVTVKAHFEPGVGVDELTIDNGKLSIYPNPVRDKLTINNGQLTIDNVEIYDLAGRKQKIIFNFQFSIFNSIDVSHLPRGVYILKVDNKTAKFVKE